MAELINDAGSLTAVDVYQRRTKEVHRHLSPRYNKPFVNVPLVNMIKGKVTNFNWHKCEPMVQLRKQGGSILTKIYPDGSKRYRKIEPRRTSIRKEREYTLNALLRAIINNTDYNLSARHLFECTLSIEQLAKEVGQFYQYAPNYSGNDTYRHGRNSCDPVRGAIDDLEACKLVFVIREFCVEAKTYKASRLFLTPLFFQSLGVTGKEMAQLRKNQANYYSRAGKTRNFRKKPTISDRMANVSDIPSLNSIFNYHHRWINGELEAEAIAQRKFEEHKKSQEALSRDERMGAMQTTHEHALQKIRATLNGIPRVQIYPAESEVDKEQPSLVKGSLPYYEAVLNRIRS